MLASPDNRRGASNEVGTSLSKDAAAHALALVWDASASVQVSVGYDGLIGNNGENHTGRAMVSFRF